MNNILHRILLSIAVFLFIYTFQIPGLPQIFLSYRCVVVLGFIYAFIFGAKVLHPTTSISDNLVSNYSIWNVFLTIYVIMILELFGHGKGTSHESTNDYINMFIVLPLFYYSGKRIFRDLDDLMWVLRTVGLMQSLIILLGTLIPEINSTLIILNSDSAFSEAGRMDNMIASGYHLGFKCFTSLGSMQLALSQIAACYFLFRNSNIVNLVFFLLISVSSVLLSRTGFLVALICLLFFLFNKANKNRWNLFFSIIFLTGAFLVVISFSNFDYGEFFRVNFNRLFILFENGLYESYFEIYIGANDENQIPPLSIYTIIGTGITSGVSGANIIVNCDGAFLRNYAAMGFVISIVNYYLLFSFFYKIYKYSKIKTNKLLILVVALIWFVGEFKEYFTYQVYYMCFIMLIFSFIERTEINSKTNRK